MTIPSVRSALVPVVLALLTLGVVWAGPSAVAAKRCQNWSPPTPNPSSTKNELFGVDALSTCSAWAVGDYEVGSVSETLILHWNGHVWRQQSSPNVGVKGSYLSGVSALSSKNVWAVGYFISGTQYRTLILHWNGKAWRRQKSPNVLSQNNQLNSVAAISPHDAWAVGSREPGSTKSRNLMLHWNGAAWRIRKVPNPGSIVDTLNDVTAVSADQAWAVGTEGDQFIPCPGRPMVSPAACSASHPMILHWNGTSWKLQQVASPGIGFNYLRGVEATSPSHAWAVGAYDNGTSDNHPLTVLWNGRAWKVKPSPAQGSAFLLDVAEGSRSTAWAVGFQSKSSVQKTLIMHWNGRAWTRQPSPNPGSAYNYLAGVAADSPSSAWAVGNYSEGSGNRTLALHCC